MRLFGYFEGKMVNVVMFDCCFQKCLLNLCTGAEQLHEKQALLRKTRKALQFRFKLRWRPLCFFRWVAMTENGKRLKQGYLADMLK